MAREVTVEPDERFRRAMAWGGRPLERWVAPAAGSPRAGGRGERPEDWPRRLAAFLMRRRRLAFAWGRTDCLMTAADWVAEMRGFDPAARWRGRYTTALGAARVLARAGYASLEEALDAVLETVQPVRAQRGDLVLLPVPGREDAGESLARMAVGIVTGPEAMVPQPEGVADLPVRLAVGAWRV